MSSKNIHVFGGTSDAVLLCQALEDLGLAYSLSVATKVGEETAVSLKGQIFVGRLDGEQMATFFAEHAIDLVIDATHPFAEVVSKNIAIVTEKMSISLIRYDRPSQISELDSPLLIKVHSIEEACEKIASLGNKVFLTTGSKDLPTYKKYLPEQRLIARVLPTADVMESCATLGMGTGDIVAIKGPFTRDMNRVMYQFYSPDSVVTKESGSEGGYLDKVIPCLELGIPCVVICRPQYEYLCRVSTIDELKEKLRLS